MTCHVRFAGEETEQLLCCYVMDARKVITWLVLYQRSPRYRWETGGAAAVSLQGFRCFRRWWCRRKKSKKAGGGLEYQIRWKGFKAKDDAWEPASNITPDLLEEYHGRPEVKAKTVAAVASVQPDISKEELTSLGYRGLADFKSGEDVRWTSGQQAKTVLSKLLPGSWESSDASDLGHHCPRGCKFNVRAGALGEISAQAARVLHQALDYGQLSTVVTMHQRRVPADLSWGWNRCIAGTAELKPWKGLP